MIVVSDTSCLSGKPFLADLRKKAGFYLSEKLEMQVLQAADEL